MLCMLARDAEIVCIDVNTNRYCVCWGEILKWFVSVLVGVACTGV